MADFFKLVFAAIVAAAVGQNCYRSLHTGVFSSVRYRTARRDREPIGYWAGVIASGFASIANTVMIVLWILWA